MLEGSPTIGRMAMIFAAFFGTVAVGGERPLVLQAHWYPQAQFAGYMVAVEKGFFAEAGLGRVELKWSIAGEKPFDRLAEGKTDFCLGWLADAIVERQGGKPLVNIAQIFQRSNLMLVARKGAGIAEPKDLSGRRVGLWGGNFDVPARTFFRQFHVEPVIVPQSNSMTPFVRGAVDAASAMHYNEFHKLIESGMKAEDLKVFAFADYGIAFPEDGLYCTETTRRDRPDVCRKMVAACRKGWEYAMANESETLDIVMKQCRAANARTNRNHQQWMLRASIQSIGDQIAGDRIAGTKPAAFGQLSPEVYKKLVDALAAEKIVAKAPAYEVIHQPLEK